MGLLEGRVAIVTGAGRGLGEEHARQLAAEGAKVVVNDLGVDLSGGAMSDTPAEVVASSIVDRGGFAVPNHDDIGTWEGARCLVEATVERFGQLDILVNNAGILRDRMSFNMSESDWDDVIRVHLKGHFASSHFAARHWRALYKAGNDVYGRIVNTTSESGLLGQPGQVNYGAAKGGIATMTVTMARELERLGITVNAISPRARTRMTVGVTGEQAPADGFDERHPGNVSPVVVWLASELAHDVTGQVFVVGEGKVYCLEPWHEVGLIQKRARWTAEEIDAARDELFGGRPSSIGPFAKTGTASAELGIRLT
jgi:NAD(P)-dependent dehydrogenase (short-subunit alcohol dehydrogenase family)